MGRERTLLERIAAGGQRRGTAYDSTREDVEALMDSVRKRLAVLLNSRHGMSEALPDYGLPSLVDLTVGSGDYVQIVGNAIKTAVEKYEPRMRRVRVTHKSDESAENQGRKLVFRIEGMLVGQDAEHRVWYETAMTSGGEFDVAD